MPPPVKGLVTLPLDIVRSEIDTVAPTTQTIRTVAVCWIVRFEAPGPSIVMLAVMSGSCESSTIVPVTPNWMVLPVLESAWVMQ